MPAGLDGNPDPVVTRMRSLLIGRVASAIGALQAHGQVLVAIDGASGTGKSTFADELARAVPDRLVIRASIDSFHRRRAQRYRRGKNSAEGYYRDSHDLESLQQQLLRPFAAGTGPMRTAIFDEPSDSPIDEPPVAVAVPGILIVDGLFLQRGELVGYWDLAVYLVADARRATAWATYVTEDLPDDADQRPGEIERRTAQGRRGRYLSGPRTLRTRGGPAPPRRLRHRQRRSR
jgi:uridine kinase